MSLVDAAPRRPHPGAGDLVGRDRELAAVAAALTGALHGRGGLVLVAGEAGSGKTAIAEHAGGLAADRGARVVWGRCWDGVDAPPYWPWVQVLRALRGSMVAVPGGDPVAAHDTVAAALASGAAPRGLVVVLDDLHGADADSLRLLAPLARWARGFRLLLVGTYREVEARRRPGVAALLARAATSATAVALPPLDADAVAALVEQLGSDRDPASVHADSAGNALLARDLAGAGAPSPAVRGWVAERVGALPEGARRLVAVAAVAGGEVTVDLLGRVAGLTSADLAEAEDAGVLTRRGPGLVGFAHGIVPRCLVDDLPAARRSALHHAVAEALEAEGAPAAVLAHHFARGEPEDTVRAWRHARRAGDEAAAALDWCTAAEHYATAAVAAAAGGVDDEERYGTLVALGDARTRAADCAGARDALRQAAAVARKAGAPELAAEAVARVPQSLAGVGTRAGETDRFLVADLEAALRDLGPERARLRARVRAGLALASFWTAPPEEARALATAAVAEARTAGDELVLAAALHADRAVHTGPEHTCRRLATADEVVRLAERHGDARLALEARIGRVADRLELGDLDGVDEDVAAVDRAARATGDPRARWHVATWRAMRALMQGRFADAEAAGDEAMAIAARAGDADGVECVVVQRLTQYWSQGRADDVQRLLAEGVERDPPLPAWRCAMASFHADRGDADGARRELEALDAEGFAGIPRDHDWTIAVASLARACAFLGDGPRAEQVHDLLAPFADRYVVVGPGVLWSGPVAHALGLLASATGELDAAIGHLEAAIDASDRLRAPGYAAESRRRLAEVLAARGRRGDAERARGLLLEATSAFTRLGMPADAAAARERLAALGGRAPAAPKEPALVAVSSPPPATARFTCEGDHWRVAYAGVEARVKDAVGVRHLATLLARPGQEVLALELAGGGSAPAAAAGDLGPLLDERAKAAYRARIAELDADLADAEAAGDAVRAELARAEREQFVDHLTASLGLGGRARKAGSAAEKARLSVTKAIRYSIRRIADRHPVLGQHLRAAVRTGTYCCYEPVEGIDVAWQVDLPA